MFSAVASSETLLRDMDRQRLFGALPSTKHLCTLCLFLCIFPELFFQQHENSTFDWCPIRTYYQTGQEPVGEYWLVSKM